MEFMKLDIQLFSSSDGKIVIDTEINTKDFEKGLNQMKNSSKNAGGTIKNIVAGLGITKLISTAMSQITSSIDGAIARYDTLNQFPRVMQNLGQSTEDSQKAIDKMAEKLSGLPTTLDQGTLAVQRFTSKNNNVAKSTDLFLALNNALLAGGANAEIQSSALEQLSQAYAKGKPDMIEWRSAMTAMPAQLNQVAKSMGMVDADALGEALRNGKVSMDDFMNEIVKLNTEGVDGFASFEKQARSSTGGINTSITVAKTQIIKGVADIIDALNIKGEQLGIGSISDIITNVGKKAKIALDMVAKLITGEISAFDFGASVGKTITNLLNNFNTQAPKLIDVGIKLMADLIKGFTSALPDIIATATDTILTLVDNLVDNIDEVIDTAFMIIEALANGLIKALPKLIEKIPIIIDKLVTKLTSPDMIAKLLSASAQIVTQLAIGLIRAIPQLTKAIAQINVSVIKGLYNLVASTDIKNIGKSLVQGIWQGISNGSTWLKDKIRGWVGNIKDFLKKMFKIGSPSKLMRDEIGIYLAQGVGVGFTDELSGVYANMQKAINFENAKLQSNVEMGKVFNTAYASTPITVNLDANVEMDNQKVGRLVAPSVMQTVKTKGGY